MKNKIVTLYNYFKNILAYSTQYSIKIKNKIVAFYAYLKNNLEYSINLFNNITTKIVAFYEYFKKNFLAFISICYKLGDIALFPVDYAGNLIGCFFFAFFDITLVEILMCSPPGITLLVFGLAQHIAFAKKIVLFPSIIVLHGGYLLLFSITLLLFQTISALKKNEYPLPSYVDFKLLGISPRSFANCLYIIPVLLFLLLIFEVYNTNVLEIRNDRELHALWELKQEQAQNAIRLEEIEKRELEINRLMEEFNQKFPDSNEFPKNKKN